MKHHHFAAFLALIASYIALHFYAASWITRNFAVQAGAARALRTAFLLLAFFAPFTMFLRHRYSGPALEPVYFAGYAWMGAILIAGSVFLLSDLLSPAARRLLSPEHAAWPPRAALLALGAALAYAFYGGVKAPAFKEMRLSVPGLPPALEGAVVAQISDVHLDSALKLARFASTMNALRERRPDLVLITGDLVDPGLPRGPELAAAIRSLRPRLGVFGVLGNHEYYFGMEKAAALYEECGITLLRNSWLETGGFRIAGIGDIMTEGLTETSVAGILGRERREGAAILMSHQPLMLETMAGNGTFVGFSGHTHGGQIFPFHLLTRMVYGHFYGLYRFGSSFFYVTSGEGCWGPPMRLFAPSEIPLVTLTRA